ncbi:Chromosome partition protein Smc [Rubripirellula lacrimiformis]|uniref:Chromosome partition protein Smc n=1 Tax=Rubripirellula lacrimiformis TaxID=1930273 RepID=A0A517N8U8_9BACT|nr:c-type cytochrome domain-containing protein [Rubripirellula lacrimiformis]QDT03557.1 Chromosome partition protein Smc [Rubripirellula lacrimiformis]
MYKQISAIAILATILSGSLASGLLGTSTVRGEDAKSTPAAPKVTFDDHIKPIFRQHCATCHNQGDKKGGLAVDSFAALMEGGGSGEVVFDDGDAEGSRLWQLVNHDDTPVMPPNQDRIPDEQLKLIRAWIEGGILENSGSKAKAKKKNNLAFVASAGGRPEGGGAMPESIPQTTPVLTDRPAATTAIAASPWAPLVAIAGQKQIVMYHSDSGELLGILPFDEGVAQSLRFSRDGAFLIAGGGEHSVRGVVAVYDVKTGQRVAAVGDELDTVFGGDVNDNMTRIALGGPQKMLRIYDATDGTQLFDLKKHTDWIYTVAYSPDGILIASGDRSGGLCVWEADSGRVYLDLTDHKGAIMAVAWRDDSNVMASASEDGTVKLWDMVQGKAIKSISAHGGGVNSVAFDHEGRLVTAGKDNRVKLWDASGNHIRDFEPMAEDVLEVAITHDGKRVVYGDWTGQIVSTLTDDPKQKSELAANPPPVTKRLESVKQTLVSVQTELAPIKAAWDAANQLVAAAQKPIDELTAKIAAKKAAAQSETKAAEASRNLAAKIQQELPQQTAASRDRQDSLTAARVGLLAGTVNEAAVADQEQAMAEQLMALAKKRREQIAATAAIDTHTKLAVEHEAAATQLATGMAALQTALKTAQEAAGAAKTQFDQVAQRLAEVQTKHDRLAAAVK